MAKKDNNTGAKQSGGWQKVTPPPASPEEKGAATPETENKAVPTNTQSDTPPKVVETENPSTPPTKSIGGKQRQNGAGASKKKKSPPTQKAVVSEEVDTLTPQTSTISEKKIEKQDSKILPKKEPETQNPKSSPKEEPAKNVEEKSKSASATKTESKAQEPAQEKKKVSPQKSQPNRSPKKAAKRRSDDDWEEDMRLNGSSRKYTAAVPIGGVFVLLALIGLITVITFSVQATERLIDNSKEKEMFGNMILPVLMFDPVPFEDPSEITEIPLLRSSIWSAITQNMEKYTFIEGTAITVPKSDVDVACARLFGPGVTLKHQSFEDDISLYSYNVDIQSYYIPADANILYTPQVEEISKKGDIFSLTVGYIAPNTQWMETLRGDKSEPIPSKYMIYEMKKVDDHYQLVSIKDPPEGAVPGVPQIQPQDAITVPSGGDQSNGGTVEIQPLEPAIEGQPTPGENAESVEGTVPPEEGSTSEAV